MATRSRIHLFTLLLLAALSALACNFPGLGLTPQEAVDTAAIATSAIATYDAELAAALPTATRTPRPTATPNVATQVAEGVAATQAAMEAPASTVTISTVTPSPEGETVAQDPSPAAPAAGEEESNTGITPVFTRTYVLELPEFYSEPIRLAGWSPIELHPDGNWYREHTALDTWMSIGETWKRASDGCGLPGACNVFSPSGVLGADDLEEANANPSAVWTGSMWHDSPDGDGYDMNCPEGSFCDTFAKQFGNVTIGDPADPFMTLSIPSCGDHCSQGLTIRNWLQQPGVDLNTNIRVQDYGSPSAASWTEYNVPFEAAEYKSEGYLTDRVVSGHMRHVDGSGPDDNKLHIQWVLDLNDVSVTALGHTQETGWFLVWTNVVQYGNH